MSKLPPGFVINQRFRVLEPLGQGGMGTVYRGEQIPLGRPVALKITRGDIPDRLRLSYEHRFFREASLCAGLSHPNIVTIYDYGRVEGTKDASIVYFLAMELINGKTLGSLLKSYKRLPILEALDIVLAVARGLRHAHNQGLIHRDLKPENIMLIPDEDGHHVKIVDFGLVKQIEGAERLTASGSFLGSPAYMSPEQGVAGPIDHRADLYSLGVVLYESLCGELPFAGENPLQIMMAHASLPPPRMSERNPRCVVPPGLEALVHKLLAKTSQERPQSAAEVMSSLQSIQEEILPKHGQGKARSLASYGPRSLWVLSQDPAFSRPPFPEVMRQLRANPAILLVEIDPEQGELLRAQLEQGKLQPPWVLLFGDLQVILENPLLGGLQSWGEISKILVSTHLNPEMLQQGINFCGLNYHICLPETAENIVASIERMLARAREIRAR